MGANQSICLIVLDILEVQSGKGGFFKTEKSVTVAAVSCTNSSTNPKIKEDATRVMHQQFTAALEGLDHFFPCALPLRPPGGFGAAGVLHDNQRAQTCTFEGPGLDKHHQNSTRRPPREGRKERNFRWEREKKAKFWAVRRRGGPVPGRGPRIHQKS